MQNLFQFSWGAMLREKGDVEVINNDKMLWVVRPCPNWRLRLQLRLDQRVYQCWRIADARDLAVAVAEVAVSDTA